MSKSKSAKMKDAAKRALQPKLRFPKFRGAGEWNAAPLKNLVSTVTPPKKLQKESYLASGEFPVVDQSQDFICGWTNDATALIEEPLPLVVFGDHTCALKLVDQPFAQGADGIKILNSKGPISNEFLYYSLSHQPLEMEDYKRHFSTLKERQVYFSDLELGEQQKIADCLSSLDELIAAHSRKLDALKAHKKGLMQQLFPREGETLPRLRFPEFKDAPEWRETPLGKIVDFQSGGTPSKKNPDFWNGTLAWASAKDMKQLELGDTQDHITKAAVADGAKLVPKERS